MLVATSRKQFLRVTGRSYSASMHNCRSAWRRFGRLPRRNLNRVRSGGVWPQNTVWFSATATVLETVVLAGSRSLPGSQNFLSTRNYRVCVERSEYGPDAFKCSRTLTNIQSFAFCTSHSPLPPRVESCLRAGDWSWTIREGSSSKRGVNSLCWFFVLSFLPQ